MKILKNYFLKKLCLKIFNDLDFEHYYKGTIKKIVGKNITHTSSFLNNKCQQVSRDVYNEDKNNKIVIAWCSTNNDENGFVHFLNYNEETDTYIDNTLGGEKIHYNYYVFNSKWVQESADNELPNPSSWLTAFRNDIYVKYCTNWVWKLFIKTNDI